MPEGLPIEATVVSLLLHVPRGATILVNKVVESTSRIESPEIGGDGGIIS